MKSSKKQSHDTIEDLAVEYIELLNYLDTHEPTEHDIDRLAYIENILS